MAARSSAAYPRGRAVHDQQATAAEDPVLEVHDHGGSGPNGGALDALWRLEAAYHFLLNHELAASHAAFVDDLYDAMDHARASLEQQSARVLAVLHDKDVRIQELEQELLYVTTAGQSVDVGVQTAIEKPTSSVNDRAVQCDDDGGEVESLPVRMEEKEEQIEVLLDELERLQRMLADKEMADRDTQTTPTDLQDIRGLREVQELCGVSMATQTEEAPAETSGFNPADALAAIESLQTQLKMVEKRNTELLTAERQRKKAEREDVGLSLDGVEKQLFDAIRTMESSTSAVCAVSDLQMSEDGEMSCLDLEHQLQGVLVERDQLADQLLALRSEFCKPSRSSAVVHSQLSSLPEERKSVCKELTCLHTLRRIVRFVQSRKKQANEVADAAKTLKNELRRALRGRENIDEIAGVAARVTRQWIEWEDRHVEEMEALRYRHQHDVDVIGSRIACLVGEVYRIRQLNIDLEAQLKASRRAGHAIGAQEVTTLSTVDSHHRVIMLEQSLQVAHEQLGVAQRAIQALSAGGDGSYIRAVHFADSESASAGQLSLTSGAKALDWRRQIKQLSEELMIAKSQQFKRLLPLNASEDAVVEYFRLEREALRLRKRLNEKDQHIRQLEIHREQLEKNYNGLHGKLESRELLRALNQHVVGHSRVNDRGTQRVSDILQLCHLRNQNAELRAELVKGRSRVLYLEKELSKCQERRGGEDASGMTGSLTSKIEQHHNRALRAFSLWQTSVRQHHEELPLDEKPISSAYAILLAHYEVLSTQFRLLQESATSWSVPHPSEQVDDFVDLPTHWQLVEKVNVLQDRLLRLHTCQSCGAQVEPPITVQQVDKATSTMALSASNASSQTPAREHRKPHETKCVQVSFVSLQSEESHPRIDASINKSTTGPHHSTAPSSQNAMVASPESQGIQQQLEASLARIAELTAREEKLKERLNQAQLASKKHAKEREKLLSQVNEVSSSNASLSSKVQEYERLMEDQKESAGAVSKAMDDELPCDELMKVQQKLSLREAESVELVRQLCEAKERCFQLEKDRGDAERKAAQLSATLEAKQLSRDHEKNAHLEVYMSKVNQSLEAIERDKQTLAMENKQLQLRLSEIEAERAKKEGSSARSVGTETVDDPAADISRLVALPEHQRLQTQVVVLSSELANERREHERVCRALADEKSDSSRRIDVELQSIHHDKAELARITEELKLSHESLQQEFDEFQVVNAEAKAEADKRIEFLTKCVEECSRLVDSTAPGDEIVTARDIYDTIISVSKRVVAGRSRTGDSNPLKKMVPKSVLAISRADTDTNSTGHSKPKDEQASGAVLHSQLQAETWRVRVAKLEMSLRAASLKNNTFEDMVDHLEVQMDHLREEVKDRMSKESALLAKQGQMKVEITNLKAQVATLTSRLTEACSELKRTQDAAKQNDGEISRLRSALQRKTELLTRQKTKADETQQALENSVKRIAQLENSEKLLASTQLKFKDQVQQLQELRQQCLVYRDSNVELNAQVHKCKEQLVESQSRLKGLRLDNGLLRYQVRELKKAAKKEVEQAGQGVAIGVSAEGKLSGEGLTASSAIEMLTTQVKTLKRRVLQKQEVVAAQKTKLSELDTEVVMLRSKLFDISQSYRQQHQFQQQKEQSMMQGVTHLKEELEATVARRAEQLDGLRASIFDACEVFIQCELSAEPTHSHHPSRPRSTASSTSSASLTPPDQDDEGFSERGHITGELLLELRRYADLSPADLADLHITDSPRKTSSSSRQRHQDLYAQQRAQKQGQQLLVDLEHALEVSPQDCRTEICQVLEFLCSKRMHTRTARRY